VYLGIFLMVTALMGVPASPRTVKRLFTCKQTRIVRLEKFWILEKPSDS
jgi:hypothetical protein